MTTAESAVEIATSKSPSATIPHPQIHERSPPRIGKLQLVSHPDPAIHHLLSFRLPHATEIPQKVNPALAQLNSAGEMIEQLWFRLTPSGRSYGEYFSTHFPGALHQQLMLYRGIDRPPDRPFFQTPFHPSELDKIKEAESLLPPTATVQQRVSAQVQEKTGPRLSLYVLININHSSRG